MTAILSKLQTTLESPSRRLRDVLDLEGARRAADSFQHDATREICPTCGSQTLDLSITPGQFVSYTLLFTFGIFTWSLNGAPNKTILIKYFDSDCRFLNFASLLFSLYIWYPHWHIFGQFGSLQGDRFLFLFSVKYVFGFSQNVSNSCKSEQKSCSHCIIWLKKWNKGIKS